MSPGWNEEILVRELERVSAEDGNGLWPVIAREVPGDFLRKLLTELETEFAGKPPQPHGAQILIRLKRRFLERGKEVPWTKTAAGKKAL